jgi:hypothetical protein
MIYDKTMIKKECTAIVAFQVFVTIEQALLGIGTEVDTCKGQNFRYEHFAEVTFKLDYWLKIFTNIVLLTFIISF